MGHYLSICVSKRLGNKWLSAVEGAGFLPEDDNDSSRTLMGLPAEIRIKVFEQVFMYKRIEWHPYEPVGKHRGITTNLLVSKQYFREARAALLSAGWVDIAAAYQLDHRISPLMLNDFKRISHLVMRSDYYYYSSGRANLKAVEEVIGVLPNLERVELLGNKCLELGREFWECLSTDLSPEMPKAWNWLVEQVKPERGELRLRKLTPAGREHLKERIQDHLKRCFETGFGEHDFSSSVAPELMGVLKVWVRNGRKFEIVLWHQILHHNLGRGLPELPFLQTWMVSLNLRSRAVDLTVWRGRMQNHRCEVRPLIDSSFLEDLLERYVL